MEREKARARSFSWCQRNNLILNEWIYSSRKANSWRKTLSPSIYYYCCISIPLSNLNPWDLSSLLLLSLRVSLFFFCSFFIFPWNITLSQSWLLQANSNPLIFTGQDLTLFIIIFFSSAFVHFAFMDQLVRSIHVNAPTCVFALRIFSYNAVASVNLIRNVLLSIAFRSFLVLVNPIRCFGSICVFWCNCNF